MRLEVGRKFVVFLVIVVMIGWVFFRADSIAKAVAFLQAMSGLTTAAPSAFTVRWFVTPEVAIAFAAGLIGSTPIVPALGRWRDRRADRLTVSWSLETAGAAMLIALLVASILQVAARTYNPFIYFRF